MKKLTDEKWRKVMDQTQGHKVGRAIYEALQETWLEESPFSNAKWEDLYAITRQRYIDVAGKLFDDEVIEGGNALPKLYNESQE